MGSNGEGAKRGADGVRMVSQHKVGSVRSEEAEAKSSGLYKRM